MAHHQYSTPAFVIESIPKGEANRLYTLFTRDLGMIKATAQGVRLQKSKLKASLQDFSITHVAVVRGKEMWRLTNAHLEKNLFTSFGKDKAIFLVIAQIATLLKRLIPGEEKHDSLYLYVVEAFEFLETAELTGEAVSAFERIMVLNILQELGYGGHEPTLRVFIGVPMSLDLIETMKSFKKIALQEINTSLRETQL